MMLIAQPMIWIAVAAWVCGSGSFGSCFVEFPRECAETLRAMCPLTDYERKRSYADKTTS